MSYPVGLCAILLVYVGKIHVYAALMCHMDADPHTAPAGQC